MEIVNGPSRPVYRVSEANEMKNGRLQTGDSERCEWHWGGGGRGVGTVPVGMFDGRSGLSD